MTGTPAAVVAQSEPPRSATVKSRRLFLVVALGFVLLSRLLLYFGSPDRHTDFDLLYNAAAQVLEGENPYRIATQWFPYPLPAALLAVPFTAIPLELARPIFDILVGWAFVFALWRHRGPLGLLAVVSGAYLFAMWNGQTTPLMVAAGLIPALGFLLAVKPNTSAPLWVARPSPMSLWGVGAFVVLSLWVLPTWPQDWWTALQVDATQALPPILRPFGLVLLFAVLRWRLPEGRLLLAIAFIPQNILPYELVSLAIIPASLLEMGMFVGGSWIAVAVATQMHFSHSLAELTATTWPATLCAGYLPMLYLVLRRPSGRPLVGRERRRPYRLPDDELEVDVSPSAEGGFTVQVTHIPTQLFAIESGPNRDVVRRKAHDKLAGILARTRRLAEKKEA